MKKVYFIFVAMFFFALFARAQGSVITPQTGDANNPPYDITGYIGTQIGNTFHVTKHLTPQNSFLFRVTSDSICNAYVFLASDPSLYSQSFQTTVFNNYTEGQLQLNLPIEGDYIFLVVTAGENASYCRKIVLGVEEYNNVPVSHNFYPYSHSTSQKYNVFTCSSTMDTQLYIVEGSNPGVITAYNDDYQGVSDFSWGSLSRVSKLFPNTTSGVIVTMTPPNIPSTNPLFGLLSLYLGAKNTASNINSYFSLLKPADGIHSAPATSTYNCISWSGGEWDYWEWPPDYFSDYYDPNDLVSFDNYYASRNRYRTGAFPAVIDLWAYFNATDTSFTHASVRALSNSYALGYDWESKAGSLERFFHPRNALRTNNKGYGNICLSYYKPLVPMGEVEMSADEILAQSFLPDTTDYIYSVFENIQFTGDDLAVIGKMEDAITQSDKNEFCILYESANDVFTHSAISSLDVLSQENTYLALLSFCKSHPSVAPLIYQRLDKGDIMAVKLTGDILVPANPDQFILLRNYIKTHGVTEEGVPLRRTLQSNATLFVKSLLADSRLPIQKKASEGVTFSTDTSIFSVDVKGLDINIRLDLDKASSVHVNVATLNGHFIKEIIAGKEMDKGQYHLSARLPAKGSYIVTCIINSRVYSRKVSVK